MEFLVTFQPIWTVIVAILFFGIVFWAFSGKRKKHYEDIAQSVVDEDDDALESKKKKKKHV